VELNTKKIGAVTIAAFIALILLGQMITYTDTYHSEFSAERNGSVISYNINSNLSLNYTAVALDNGDLYQIERYVAFYDESYPMFDDAEDVKDSIKWLQHNLEKYNIDLEMADADEILDVVSGLDTKTAIVFATGTLPSEIYDGTSSSPIFDWLKAGGVMYWIGGKIGYTYAERETSELKEVPDKELLFFGNNDVIREETEKVYARNLIEGSLTDVAGIYFNEYTNGIDTSKLTGPFMSLDYSEDGYSSVVFAKYYDGDGMICNLGGILNHDTAHTAAQTIAPGLTHVSAVVDHCTGQISKNPSGELQTVAGKTDVFIYIGTMSVIGGQWFRL